MGEEDMLNRMKNSALKCDQEQRALAIKLGKSSTVKIIYPDDSEKTVKSFEIKSFVDIDWGRVKYLCDRYDGFDKNTGIKYLILERYTGGNKWKNLK
jgi:hypothetical protein